MPLSHIRPKKLLPNAHSLILEGAERAIEWGYERRDHHLVLVKLRQLRKFEVCRYDDARSVTVK